MINLMNGLQYLIKKFNKSNYNIISDYLGNKGAKGNPKNAVFIEIGGKGECLQESGNSFEFTQNITFWHQCKYERRNPFDWMKLQNQVYKLILENDSTLNSYIINIVLIDEDVNSSTLATNDSSNMVAGLNGDIKLNRYTFQFTYCFNPET